MCIVTFSERCNKSCCNITFVTWEMSQNPCHMGKEMVFKISLEKCQNIWRALLATTLYFLRNLWRRKRPFRRKSCLHLLRRLQRGWRSLDFVRKPRREEAASRGRGWRANQIVSKRKRRRIFQELWWWGNERSS